MKYATATAFRTALETRLRQHANQRGVPTPRLRKLVAFERFMARLLVVAPDRWIVKGGVALDFRMGDRARMTVDLDLARHSEAGLAEADIFAALSADLKDFFTFEIRPEPTFGPLGEIAATRYRTAARLDERRFEEFVFDVGVGDPPVLVPDLLTGPPLLEFADIAPISVPALPLEQHLAEKLHAYTRTYTGNRTNSRAKDLVDMVLIGSFGQFRANRIQGAIAATFTTRSTHDVPPALPLPPSSWGIQYARIATGVDLNPDVNEGYKLAAAFFDPVLQGVVTTDKVWDPATWTWNASPDD